MNTRKKEILTALTIFALAAGLVIALSLSLWLFRNSERGKQNAHNIATRFYTDPATGLRLFTPNLKTGLVRINNLGFRGPDIPLQKPENVFRIAFLGPSTTEDGRNPEGLNWPHLLVEQLRSVIKGCELDFVNAGHPGYTFPKMAIVYENYVAQTDPDIVIVMVGGVRNALNPLARQQGFEVNHGGPGAQSAVLGLLRRKLDHAINVINYVLADHPDANKLKLDSQRVATKLTADLKALLEVVSDGQRLVAVVASVSRLSESLPAIKQAWVSPVLLEQYPFLHLPDYIELRKTYNQMSAQAVIDYGAIALPGIEGLPHNSNYFRDRIHFSVPGARVMAKQMFQQLIDRAEVEALIAKRGCSIVKQ